MKKIFLLCVCVIWLTTGVVSGFDVLEDLSIPLSPSERVTDIADILTDSEESQLNTQLKEFDETHNVEVAIVTLPELGWYAIEEVGIAIWDAWQVGKDGVDSGIIVLMSLDERQWRIETGYGVEWDIPDILASRLGESILVPAFREQKYAGWFARLVQSFSDLLAGVFPGDLGVPLELDRSVMTLFLLGILSFFIASVLRWVFGADMDLRSKAANIWPLTTGLFWLLLGGTLSGGLVLFVAMTFVWSMVMLAQQMWSSRSRDSRWWFQWWFGSTGGRGWWSFGGGFSGFGGWSFGGGWASGSW